MQAEQRRDYSLSIRFLTVASRQEFKTVDQWAAHRKALPGVPTFHIERQAPPSKTAKAAGVIAVVERPAHFDPLGFVPAKEREIWIAHHTKSGWLVEADPRIELVLPDETLAQSVVQSWVSALQQCDHVAAANYEQPPSILGTAAVSTKLRNLCKAPGKMTVGAVSKLTTGPVLTNMTSRYGTSVKDWARLIPVTGAVPFQVVVAPVSDSWKVVASYD